MAELYAQRNKGPITITRMEGVPGIPNATRYQLVIIIPFTHTRASLQFVLVIFDHP